MILSLQGCMAVGKTTAITYLKEHAPYMGHPLNPLVWLARTLGEQGVTLRAGDLILTGSFCGAAPVAAGATVLCDYGHLGALTAHFQ